MNTVLGSHPCLSDQLTPSCGLLIRLRSCGHPVRPWCVSLSLFNHQHTFHIDFRGNLPLLVDAVALTLSQMRKFVVPKTSTVQVDAEQARMERVAVMAAKAGVANSLGLSWPPPLKKRVGRPSRRDLYVDSVYKHIDEHASVPAVYIGRACLVGAWHEHCAHRGRC